jgi:hypothetical protein
MDTDHWCVTNENNRNFTIRRWNELSRISRLRLDWGHIWIAWFSNRRNRKKTELRSFVFQNTTWLKHRNFARVAFGWCAGNKHGTLFVFIHKATNYSELKLWLAILLIESKLNNAKKVLLETPLNTNPMVSSDSPW